MGKYQEYGFDVLYMSTALSIVEPISPGADLDAYKRSVNSIAMLSAEEERVLAERLFYEDDVDAARQLVMSHLRFVRK